MTHPHPLSELGLTPEENARLADLARQMHDIVDPRVAEYERTHPPSRRDRWQSSLSLSWFLVVVPGVTVVAGITSLVAVIVLHNEPSFVNAAVGWTSGYAVAGGLIQIAKARALDR